MRGLTQEEATFLYECALPYLVGDGEYLADAEDRMCAALLARGLVYEDAGGWHQATPLGLLALRIHNAVALAEGVLR